MWGSNFVCSRVVFWLKWTFSLELVVLLAICTFHAQNSFGACLKMAWRFKQSIFYIESLRFKVILTWCMTRDKAGDGPSNLPLPSIYIQLQKASHTHTHTLSTLSKVPIQSCIPNIQLTPKKYWINSHNLKIQNCLCPILPKKKKSKIKSSHCPSVYIVYFFMFFGLRRLSTMYQYQVSLNNFAH